MKKIEPDLLFLVGSFSKIAKAMSRNFDVRIVPSGFECCTDGEVIKIPFNADYLNESTRQALNGMLDHEVCHVIEERVHRDAGRTTPVALLREQKNTTICYLFNAFEDVRIERKYSAKWPGVAQNLRVLQIACLDRYLADPEKIGNFWNQVGLYILLITRDMDVSWMSARTLERCEAIASEIDASLGCAWGQDCLALAKIVYEKLKLKDKEKTGEEPKSPKVMVEKIDEEEESCSTPSPEADEEDSDSEVADFAAVEADEESEDEPEEGSAPGESEDGSDEDEESEAGSGESVDEDGVDETGESESDAESAAVDDGAAGDPSGDSSGEDVESSSEFELEADATAEDLTKVLGDELKERARLEAISKGQYVPNPMLKKQDRFIKPGAHTKDEGLANYAATKEDVLKQIGVMKAKQLAYYQAMSRRKVTGGLEQGRLEDSEIASVRFGHKNVFSDVSRGRMLDTAVELLIDLSGSMGNPDVSHCGAYWAKRTAIALAEAWEALKIPYEIFGFHNLTLFGFKAEPKDSGYVNRAPFSYPIFKGWDERLPNCRHRFQYITGGQDNADGEAVMVAAQRLALRREARRILVVISDGAPACMGVPMDLNGAYLKKVVSEVSKAGIEVLGVGAGTKCVKEYYNKSTGASHIVVNDISKLAVTLFSHLQGKILASVA